MLGLRFSRAGGILFLGAILSAGSVWSQSPSVTSQASTQAQNLPAPSPNDGLSPREDSIRMHENLAQANQAVANCLKSTNASMSRCEQKMNQVCAQGQAGGCTRLSESDLRRHSITHQMGAKPGQQVAGVAGQTLTSPKPSNQQTKVTTGNPQSNGDPPSTASGRAGIPGG